MLGPIRAARGVLSGSQTSGIIIRVELMPTGCRLMSRPCCSYCCRGGGDGQNLRFSVDRALSRLSKCGWPRRISWAGTCCLQLLLGLDRPA